MTLFRKRITSPNQLQTLRKIEEEVDVGKVLYFGQGIAIVEGLNNDAPVGTKLGFVSGALGVLLWRRNDNICFVLLLGGTPEKGEGVLCKVKAILQIVDEKDGPTTKREYDIATIPVGDELVGRTVDFLGRKIGSSMQLRTGAELPLFNQQPTMDDREQICEPLLTGVKAVDALTPIGRGQALLVTGLEASGKTSLALDAILGQHSSGVRCVYAAVGQSEEEVARNLKLLKSKGAMACSTVVSAAESASLGERYAALCAACSQGERVRDGGGHALVVLDDISCMVEIWEHIAEALSSIGPSAVGDEAEAEGQPPEDPDSLVTYEGMLVSAAAAQRRRFFSMLIQRSAKLHKRKGGGSLTLLLVLGGRPATGQSQPLADVSRYQHLSPDLRAKLQAALERNKDLPEKQAEKSQSKCVRTEVVEEFMSIADGQIVMVRENCQAGVEAQSSTRPQAESVGRDFDGASTSREGMGGRGVRVDAAASVSRIGGRAYPQALRDLAQRTRLDLAQAVDEARFSSTMADPAAQRSQQQAERLRAALAQLPGHPVPLEEQVAILYALQSNKLNVVSPRHIPLWLSIYVQLLWRAHPQTMRNIAVSQTLPAEAVAVLKSALDETISQFGTL